MDFMFWGTISLIVIGFIVLASMKKSMERKLALLIANKESAKSEQTSANPIIFWIVAVAVWGIISIFLVVRLFSVYS